MAFRAYPSAFRTNLVEQGSLYRRRSKDSSIAPRTNKINFIIIGKNYHESEELYTQNIDQNRFHIELVFKRREISVNF